MSKIRDLIQEIRDVQGEPITPREPYEDSGSEEDRGIPMGSEGYDELSGTYDESLIDPDVHTRSRRQFSETEYLEYAKKILYSKGTIGPTSYVRGRKVWVRDVDTESPEIFATRILDDHFDFEISLMYHD